MAIIAKHLLVVAVLGAAYSAGYWVVWADYCERNEEVRYGTYQTAVG
jgi:hypothetical protein